jgi:ATPase family protein associated with various cellular activities (AAA)/peptidase M41-like protein
MFAQLEWTRLDNKTARTILARGLEVTYDALENIIGPAFEGQVATLVFYKRFKFLRLVNLVLPQIAETATVYALWSEKQEFFILDGTSDPIYRVNELEQLQLTSDTAEAYFRFFMFAVRGEEGAFILFEEPAKGASVTTDASKLARPLKSLPAEPEHDGVGGFAFDAVVAYGANLFEAKLTVTHAGDAQMTNDEPLNQALSPEEIPIVESLAAGGALQTWSESEVPGSRRRERAAPAVPDQSALFLLVELLLEKTLATMPRNRLIENFNASVTPSSALDQFAALVFDEFPVVVVESGMAFVEEVIADILYSRITPAPWMTRCTATPSADDTQITYNLPNKGPALVLVPLQVYKTIVNVDRMAYELATKDFAALIACETFDQLPESLRRLKDITLRLPPLDTKSFEVLFQRIMGCALPPNWDSDGAPWVRYLLHTDFGHPRRMRLPADKALDYIRNGVTERLLVVQSDQGLGLKDLNGLGEARRFAEDLISDIHGAIKGDIPWSHVDRGALLVGPPGTGKTTLARAIAKDCGVRFMSASASGWQASGEHLGHHIRAIRRTFAEARAYAPTIIFIDEIDALGSRENFSGGNAQYQTDVIDAVIEQLQGIDPAAPVFVIAATNFEDRVDPALRRSGRLDRVIRVPRPNSASLALIYDHYLRELANSIGIDQSVDTKVLGGLSLGLTGADAEKIVRGATRRARSEKRPIGQGDLIAELTNKPRGMDEYPRMSPEEIERTAVHEAGHALAMYLGAFKGSDIGFVTVVPRPDGSLGFVSFLPDERRSLTRRDYLAKLEINLAGRAAEEIKYGPDGISSGANSDLESAMGLAILMVTRFGLGGGKVLTWSADASPDHRGQAEAILVEAYGEIKRKLKENETKLMKLASELVTRQELFGSDVQAILSA